MVKSEEVTVSIGATVNLGDFNSIRVEVGRTVPVKSGDTAEQTEKRLYESLQKSLVQKVKELKEEME